ncbi:methyltransferase [Gregarina niphandrodes]|uniref:Methyltransferase n=1 Tax=Gregarina niphandrodes TaxID=110365 RepID=A0A023BB77_GRENI|nr:methyltransferase [Gregarina niphandrodes]EZG79301.1 methyltransferase [Gregarina niphandrodes]|eukprot:XP_011129070.1 methyltransferase [Gregarina niphandrodes]
MSAPKPEGLVPADIHYDVDEAVRYHKSSRNNEIQRALAQRCLELLELDVTCVESVPLVLDIGCGSGLSGDILSEAGVPWIGMDLSQSMLEIAREERADAELLRADIGELQNVVPNTFDGAISVSVIQWLCHAFTSEQEPLRRLRQFFQWLYNALNKSARAVFQFYPSHQSQVDMIGKAASQVGFSTYFLIDNAESTKKKKVFLIVTIGQPEARSLVGSTMAAASNSPRAAKHKGRQKPQSRKEWVVKKKEKMRALGKEVKSDSKYTGRKRKDRL